MAFFNGFGVELTSVLSNEADLSRIHAFPGDNYKVTSIDSFDARSFHMTIKFDNSIAAYARLTPGPNAVFHEWTQGQSSLPNEIFTIDLGRVLVNPRFQGLGLSKWIMIECSLFASTIGFKVINGTYMPEHDLMKVSLHSIGFKDCGPTIIEQESGGISVLVQPVTCNIDDDIISYWTMKRFEFIKKFHLRNFAHTR